MLIEQILNYIGSVLSWILDFINIPDMPAEIVDIMERLKVIMIDSLNVFGFFVDMDFFRICCGIFLAIYISKNIWDLIEWLMRKIPFLNVS